MSISRQWPLDAWEPAQHGRNSVKYLLKELMHVYIFVLHVPSSSRLLAGRAVTPAIKRLELHQKTHGAHRMMSVIRPEQFPVEKITAKRN